MHTFCKGCIYKAIRTGGKGCPKCGTKFTGDPRNCVKPDNTLQDLVHKLFPVDPKAEIEFYEERGIKRKSEYPLVEAEPASKPAKKKQPYVNCEDELNFQLLPVKVADMPAAKGGRKPEELELPRLQKPFLRTSGRLKVS